jgi:hypothetical protein
MSERANVAMPTLLADFRLLLILFVGFRLLMLIVYEPLGTDANQVGVAARGDFYTYYRIASLSSTVGLPFRDWWSEFPPVWSFTTVAVYQLLGGENSMYTSFAMVLGFIIIVFETGNLVLIRKIGAQLYGAATGMSLAWIYALLLVPIVFAFWNFEPIVAFFLLLGVWWLLARKDTGSAVAIAVGVLTKFTPALALGAVWRFRESGRALRYTAIVASLFALVYLLLFAQNAAMTMPSLTAQFNKASYETVWALLDGNYSTGCLCSLSQRTDPANAGVVQGNPSRVPSWLRLGIAVAIGVWIFARTRRLDDKGLVAFVAITLLVFFLQAQGWSPQWLMQIIPLVLLCFPSTKGVLTILLLSVLTFFEFPVLFIRTQGEITGELVMPFVIVVLARTGVLLGLCVAYYRLLRQPIT